YDKGLAAICKEVFGPREREYIHPLERLTGHLSGYDPTLAPSFEWPERLRNAKRKIYEKVKSQGENRQKDYVK
ncbi:MAG: hypothetical protein AAGJ83_15890, partial [Planctomycetota bacterium]